MGHLFESEWTVSKEATCISEGTRYHKCIREGCNATSDPVTYTDPDTHVGYKTVYVSGYKIHNTTQGHEIYTQCTGCGVKIKKTGNEACASSNIDTTGQSNNDGTHYGVKKCDKCLVAYWDGVASLHGTAPSQ